MRPAPSGSRRRPKFPLADWLEAHEGVPHNLGRSGMFGELRSVPPLLRHPPPADEAELRRRVGALVGAHSDRVVLTHGATEANALVLFTLAHRFRRRGTAHPRFRLRAPEYPPLGEAARWAGFSEARGNAPADLTILSQPNNPMGTSRPEREISAEGGSGTELLVDETFREFSTAPSIARHDRPGVWVTGTLTKAYGADTVRLGWAVAPTDGIGAISSASGLLLDGIGASSLAEATALLRARRKVLAETRAIFQRNRRLLAGQVADVPPLSGPTWFDRGRSGLPARRLARAALRAGVLIAPGDLFGEPTGVRVCLTRRSFGADLVAYVEVRERVVG